MHARIHPIGTRRTWSGRRSGRRRRRGEDAGGEKEERGAVAEGGRLRESVNLIRNNVR
jgi:hypothetical protein